jgi:MFS family permease
MNATGLSGSGRFIRITRRRVALATLVGTTFEWYDFFVYAQAAALVFVPLFFNPAGNEIGLMISFASVGLSFVFRPLGAVLAGYFGDKIGRRAMLVATLSLMGIATVAMGLLPTYEAIGLAAPILLIVLRVLQGIAAGGEWGGAALMAVEHAPLKHRGLFGSFPQLGVPLGMLLATGVMALMTSVVSPGAAFLEWGWRIPFLVSLILPVIGYFIRRTVDESPIFTEIADRKEQASAPLSTLFKKHGKLVLVAALLMAGMNAAGYISTGGFITSYATNPESPAAMDRTQVLIALTIACVPYFLSTLFAGILSDWIGRKRTYIIGYVSLAFMAFPLFWAADTGNIVWLTIMLSLFTVGLGLAYGAQPAWFTELFPVNVRFSGVSITFALGSILGGAFAPMIAQALLNATGSPGAVSSYLLSMSLISLGAALILRDRSKIPLGIDHLSTQETGSFSLAVKPPIWKSKDPIEATSHGQHLI